MKWSKPSAIEMGIPSAKTFGRAAHQPERLLCKDRRFSSKAAVSAGRVAVNSTSPSRKAVEP